MKGQEILKQAISNEDVYFLCKLYFNETLSPLQEILVRKVAFQSYRRFIICAMTRWGKTYCVSRGIALFILMNQNKKVFFIAPQREQASILRDYMAELIYKCEELQEITDLDVVGIEKIKKQASRSRQTFKNDCEYRVFTAHGSGEGMMGFGLGSEGGIIVVDEGALIEEDPWAKITRMLGDNPDKSTIIELLNPWDRATRVFEHWNDLSYETFHVGWEDALKDGRTTQDFIDRQRSEMTELEFDVLYNSIFPVEGEDSVFNLKKIKDAEGEGRYGAGECIISCDVADKGLDKTVIISGIKDEKGYVINKIYHEDKSDNMEIADRIMELVNENLERKIRIFIDCIGVGAGVLSAIKKRCIPINVGRIRKKIKVEGCHFGEKSIVDSTRFSNRKAEGYFRLRDMFNNKTITIPKHKILLNELLKMKWEFTGTSKIKIIDPDKSPDFADALVYFCWFEEELVWSPMLY